MSSVSTPIYLELETIREEQRKLVKFLSDNEASPSFPIQFLELMESENARLLDRTKELEKDAAILAESFEFS